MKLDTDGGDLFLPCPVQPYQWLTSHENANTVVFGRQITGWSDTAGATAPGRNKFRAMDTLFDLRLTVHAGPERSRVCSA